MASNLEEYAACPIPKCGQQNYTKPQPGSPRLHCEHWVANTGNSDWPKRFALVQSQAWDRLPESRKEEIRRWIMRSCEPAGAMLFHYGGVAFIQDSLARVLSLEAS